MVGIRVNRGYAKGVGERLAAMENVSYLGYTTGSFDILIEVHLPDNEGLYRFLERGPRGDRGHRLHGDLAHPAH